jgi:uncharacterized tellurite resistance protein B-like protein
MIYFADCMKERKFAKWIGGTMGWAVGGPIGALVGFSLGYLWDNATLESIVVGRESASGGSTGTRQGDFTVSLLVLATAMMKADDRVLKSELEYVKKFLKNQFGEQKSVELLRVIRDLLQRDIELALGLANQARGLFELLLEVAQALLAVGLFAQPVQGFFQGLLERLLFGLRQLALGQVVQAALDLGTFWRLGGLQPGSTERQPEQGDDKVGA